MKKVSFLFCAYLFVASSIHAQQEAICSSYTKGFSYFFGTSRRMAKVLTGVYIGTSLTMNGVSLFANYFYSDPSSMPISVEDQKKAIQDANIVFELIPLCATATSYLIYKLSQGCCGSSELEEDVEVGNDQLQHGG